MTTQTTVFDLLKIELLASIIGGVAIPLLDKILGHSTSRHLTWVLAAFEGKGILFEWLLISNLASFHLLDSLFNFVALWHVLRLIQPMVRYAQGLETDFGFYKLITVPEIQLYLYFGPTLAVRVARLMWSHRAFIAVVLISVVDGITSCPRSLKNRIVDAVSPYFIKFLSLHNKYDLNIRTLFINCREALMAPFDRWEIAIGHRRRERRRPSSLYKYSKLEKPRNIRLLRLNMRWFCSEPSCEIIEVPLDDAPPFEAISYTWGGQKLDIPLKVNGKKLLVTAAVDEMLFNQRSIFGSKLFWIDAICIDQSNLDEKNVQLPLMANIYRRASRVIVWLGAPKTCQETRLVRKMIRVLNWPELFLKTRDLLPGLFDNSEEEAFVAVAKLFSHKWFERVWVIQELASGKSVHIMYNGTCTDLDFLTVAAERLVLDFSLKYKIISYTYPEVTSTNASDPKLGRTATTNMMENVAWSNLSVLRNIRVSVQGGKIAPLALLLISTNHFQATDPRDKVFALLGISKDGRQLPFKPDYRDEVEDVFLKTASFLLSSAEDWFLVFTISGLGYKPPKDTEPPILSESSPSWVPDYSSNVLHLGGIRLPSFANAQSRDPGGRATITSNPRIIHLQVIPFSKISKISNVAPPFKNHRSIPYLSNPHAPPSVYSTQQDQAVDLFLSDNRRWYIESRQLAYELSSSSCISQEAVDQAFWELCMNQKEYIDDVSPPPANCDPLSPEARRFFENTFLRVQPERQEISMAEMLGNGAKTEDAVFIMLYLLKRFAASSGGKGFAITSRGEMALVPPFVKVDDLCVHVRGGYIPLVLRESRNGERMAKLVGTCKVQDVVDVYSGGGWEDWFLE